MNSYTSNKFVHVTKHCAMNIADKRVTYHGALLSNETRNRHDYGRAS